MLTIQQELEWVAHYDLIMKTEYKKSEPYVNRASEKLKEFFYKTTPWGYVENLSLIERLKKIAGIYFDKEYSNWILETESRKCAKKIKDKEGKPFASKFGDFETEEAFIHAPHKFCAFEKKLKEVEQEYERQGQKVNSQNLIQDTILFFERKPMKFYS